MSKVIYKFLTNGTDKVMKELLERSEPGTILVKGEPEGTNSHTSKQLQEMGIIGIYKKIVVD